MNKKVQMILSVLLAVALVILIAWKINYDKKQDKIERGMEKISRGAEKALDDTGRAIDEAVK